MSTSRSRSLEGAETLLASADYGVLSLVAPDGTPYALPVNFCYDPKQNLVFFHCAAQGKKLDCLRHNPAVCLCVVGPYQVVPEKYITHYRSVLVYETARIVEEPRRKRALLKRLCQRFAPDGPREQEVIEKYLPSVLLVEIAVSSITQKQNCDG